MRHLLLILAGLLAFTQAQAEIIGEEVSYKSGDTTMNGYLAYDDSVQGQRPGVLVVHEWWGHNEYARTRARMLAELGYTALAVDMYGDGKQAEHPQDAQKFSSEINQNKALGERRFKAAMEVLKDHVSTDPEQIAAIGYCFGGGVVLHMARIGTDLDAVVSFHGSLDTTTPADPGAVKAQVMVAHGGADPFVKPEHLTGFIQEMNKANAFYRVHVYSDALHAFTNPNADEYGAQFNLPLKYNAEADADSWQTMQLFLRDAFAR